MKRYILLLVFFSLGFVGSSQSVEWNESRMLAHWKQNGFDSIEGIYEQFSRPFLRLGLIKEDSIYTFIYIKTLLPELRYEEWNEGDLKATLVPLKLHNEYSCTWYDIKKRPSSGYYVLIDGRYLKLLRTFTQHRITTQFKKVYPEKP